MLPKKRFPVDCSDDVCSLPFDKNILIFKSRFSINKNIILNNNTKQVQKTTFRKGKCLILKKMFFVCFHIVLSSVAIFKKTKEMTIFL